MYEKVINRGFHDIVRLIYASCMKKIYKENKVIGLQVLKYGTDYPICNLKSDVRLKYASCMKITNWALESGRLTVLTVSESIMFNEYVKISVH